MAERGLCSRREADELIAKGLVKVDGKIIDTLGTKVLPDVHIELARIAQTKLEGLVTILLNKPIGYVSGQPEKGYEPAVRLITTETQDRDIDPQAPRLERKHFEGLAPAGRLDIDSQGLIVFTQNGTVAKHLIGSETSVEKEYLVRVEGGLDRRGFQLLNHGLELDGIRLKPAQVTWQNEDQLKFILREGRKRQIRRMCEMVGLRVVGLKRVRVGNVVLGRLKEGHWRFLKPGEMF